MQRIYSVPEISLLFSRFMPVYGCETAAAFNGIFLSCALFCCFNERIVKHAYFIQSCQSSSSFFSLRFPGYFREFDQLSCVVM